VCNSTTEVCIQVPTGNAGCVTTYVPPCVNDTDCNTGDPCKDYKCQNSSGIVRCVFPLKNCGTSDACNNYQCKPGVGCVTTIKTCNDNDMCTVDTCNPVTGCVFTPAPACPPSTDKCLVPVCDKLLGCITVPLNCSDYGVFIGNCTVPACNRNATKVNNTCYHQYVCATAPPTSSETFPQQTIILSAALGTAAIAGIVIAAVVLAAGLGTAAGVAIVGAAGAGGVAMVASNPIYAASATSGTNVIWKNDS